MGRDLLRLQRLWFRKRLVYKTEHLLRGRVEWSRMSLVWHVTSLSQFPESELVTSLVCHSFFKVSLTYH